MGYGIRTHPPTQNQELKTRSYQRAVISQYSSQRSRNYQETGMSCLRSSIFPRNLGESVAYGYGIIITRVQVLKGLKPIASRKESKLEDGLTQSQKLKALDPTTRTISPIQPKTTGIIKKL
jgi:hypothetical protein